MKILMFNVAAPTLLLFLAAALHLAFRLAYFFYVGFSLRRAQLDRSSTSEERYAAWLKFKKRAAFILDADGVTLAFVIAASLNSIVSSDSLFYVRVIGVLAVVTGVWIKVSAYRAIGVKGYYWYNFFCSDEEREYVARGVYKYINNPMYGPGYLHAVGFPLVFLSFWGLMLAVFDLIVVWAFYFIFERPHTFYYMRSPERT
jgi:protein-S-isoprenylcysteine O-methyltransferase Ste14